MIPEYPAFFTATNLNWKKLLESDKYKLIVIDSLRFLVEKERIKLFSFVIMWNHMHLIWQIQKFLDPKSVQRDFLKYTAQKIKADLKKNDPLFLEDFRVDAKDRKYQFWERNPLSKQLWNHGIFLQKLNYIHNNPVKAGICLLPEEYLYSSARFYETGIDNWGFLTHYNDQGSLVVGAPCGMKEQESLAWSGNTNNGDIIGDFSPINNQGSLVVGAPFGMKEQESLAWSGNTNNSDIIGDFSGKH